LRRIAKTLVEKRKGVRKSAARVRNLKGVAGSRAKRLFAIEFFARRNRFYTRYHHREEGWHTDESVTE
jgi:hypothetical protein